MELWQILGNQAFDDAFYAEMNEKIKVGEVWDAFVKSEIDKYKRTGILPNYVTYCTATTVSPHQQVDDSGDAQTMP